MTSRIWRDRYGSSTVVARTYSPLPGTAASTAWWAKEYRCQSATGRPGQSTVTIEGTPMTWAKSHAPDSMTLQRSWRRPTCRPRAA
jgi:hypothetical protein